MAFTSTSKHSVNDNHGTTAKSYFQKTVCLMEWWLVKAEKDIEGKRLAVAGITSRERQAVRVFSSAPILKIYDVFTLETVDGICVIIQGLMNKARTVENGFPSEVCNHFVFGFPPYWERYARKCSEGDSTLMGDAQSNSDFERLSPQPARTEGSSRRMIKKSVEACSDPETEECSNKKNSGVKSSSKGGKKKSKCNSKDGEAKSAVESNAYSASERETSIGDYSVENRKTLEPSGSHFDNNTAQHLTPSGLEENSVPSSIKGNDNVTENENYIGTKWTLKYRNSPLSACQLTNEERCNSTMQPLEDPSKVNSSKTLRKQIFFGREAHLSEELSSYSEGKVTTHSWKKVRGKFKNNETSYGKLKDEKIISVSVPLRGSNAVRNPGPNLDDRPMGKSALNPAGTEFQELTGQTTSRNPHAGSLENNVELDCGISLIVKDAKRDQNHEGVQENGGMQNKSDGHICSSLGDDEKGKKKKKTSRSKKTNSQSESPFQRKSKRKADNPASRKEKEESSVVSPESLCLRKSRSGRWLLPTLEFWRNQRVIYDADHQITGIKDLN